MNDHLRPPHPGCRTCRSRILGLTNLDGDLGHAKRNLLRAQGGHEEDLPRYVAELEVLKAKRVDEIAVYNQHYDSSHPAFSDSAAPFAKAPSHRLTDEDVAEIRRMLREGVTSYAELAEAFGVNKSTIQYHATRAGLATPDRKLTAAASTPAAVTDAEGGLTPDPSSASPRLAGGMYAEWMDRGLCQETDPEAFFPDKGGSTREAKAICQRCPVQAECLDYALDNDERFGIWGGLSERERRAVKKALEGETATEFVCSTCDHAFASESGRDRHHAEIHDRTSDDDLSCPHCDHTCRGPRGLSIHLSRTHPELRNAS